MSLSQGVAVLMGDLNSEPSSEPIKYINETHFYLNNYYPSMVRFLTGRLTIAGEKTQNMVDIWEAAGDSDGLTFSALEPKPQKRVCLK